MSRTLFLNPPCYGENFHLSGLSGCRWASLSPGTIDKTKFAERKDYYYSIFPFPLAFASGIEKAKGNESKVLDALALNLTYEETYKEIENYKPDLVVLESCAVSFEKDIQMLEYIHDFMNIAVKIVGTEVKRKRIELMKYPFIQKQEGAYYIPEDLSIQPDREMDLSIYNDYYSFERYIPKPQMQVWTSFGCPYGCTFCLWRWTITEGKYFRRPTEAIRKEIFDGIAKYGFKSVLFDDDTFNVGDKATQEIAKMMGKEFPKVQWSAMVRADSCSLDTFQIMFDNGCTGLKIGVESFAPSVLKKIDKGLNAEDLLERIIKIKQIGFNVYLSTMKYIPGETDEERHITDQMLRQLYMMGVRYQRPLCMPLPGTKMGDEFQAWELKEYGENTEDFEYGKFDTNPELQARIIRYSRSGK